MAVISGQVWGSCMCSVLCPLVPLAPGPDESCWVGAWTQQPLRGQTLHLLSPDPSCGPGHRQEEGELIIEFGLEHLGFSWQPVSF